MLKSHKIHHCTLSSWFKYSLFETLTFKGGNVKMLIHTYPHNPWGRSKVAICTHQIDSPFHMWLMWFGDLHVSMFFCFVLFCFCLVFLVSYQTPNFLTEARCHETTLHNTLRMDGTRQNALPGHCFSSACVWTQFAPKDERYDRRLALSGLWLTFLLCRQNHSVLSRLSRLYCTCINRENHCW